MSHAFLLPASGLTWSLFLQELVRLYPQFRLPALFNLGVLLLRFRLDPAAAQEVLEQLTSSPGAGKNSAAVENNLGVALEAQVPLPPGSPAPLPFQALPREAG